MKILCFDTCTEKMNVVISENNDILGCKIVQTTEKSYNSAHLIPVIIQLTKDCGILINDINAIGTNIGPGSFTGVRASATIARVMANQLDIPVVGVSSLEIYSLLNNTQKPSLCLLDARRGKAYIAVYGQNQEIIIEPQAVEYETALEKAKSGEYFVITDKKMFELMNENNINSIEISSQSDDFGKFLAELTDKHLTQNSSAENNWQNLKPLYIQPPPISTPKVKV